LRVERLTAAVFRAFGNPEHVALRGERTLALNGLVVILVPLMALLLT
jgi:hypothetical protein